MGSHHDRTRPARELVATCLLDLVGVLRRHEGLGGDGDPTDVHRMRTTVRRVRSVLSAFEVVFEPGATEAVVEDLRWLGAALSPARDAHVMRVHLAEVLAGQPVELVIDAVASRVDLELGRDERAGRATAREAVGSERFQSLLASLEQLAAAGPWSQAAEAPADLVARDALRSELKSLHRAARRASTARETDRAAAMHRVRRRAKRLRYAAECAAPALGRRSTKLASRAKAVQSALGDYQDSVVARDRLRQVGIAAHLDGLNAFTFGRLHALEEQRAERALAAGALALERLPRRGKRWLRA